MATLDKAKSASSDQSPPTVLTPIRPRKTRPSFSPRKQQKLQTPLRQSKSLDHILKDTPQAESSHARNVQPTAALNFEEFSFEDETGYHKITPAQREALDAYLKQHYGGHVEVEHAPFLFIRCETMPPENKRPFSIGGMIAVWKGPDDRIASQLKIALSPDVHPAWGPRKALPEKLRGMFDGIRRPSDVVPLYIASVIFPECKAISFLYETIVIELPAEDMKDFAARLKKLPSHLDRCTFCLRYSNGPLPQTELMKRAVKPQPEILENNICDVTDYISLTGQFNPGAMIVAVDGHGMPCGGATAGILVHRGASERLTCPYHMWKDHMNKEDVPESFKMTPEEIKDLFGKTSEVAQEKFALRQGLNPGTSIGFARERVKDTDIALVQLRSGIDFENIPLDSFMPIKKLVHTQDQQTGDLYVINSFTTGEQKLICLGSRFTFARDGPVSSNVPQEGVDVLPTPNVTYIAAKQGIHASNEPIMSQPPFIREGVCGAPLIRIYDKERTRKGYEESEEQVRSRGEVCGMMHFVDVVNQWSEEVMGLSNYLVFADAFDPLIEQGWKIVPVPPNRMQELAERNVFEQQKVNEQQLAGSLLKRQRSGTVDIESEPQEVDEEQSEESPSKRQKINDANVETESAGRK